MAKLPALATRLITGVVVVAIVAVGAYYLFFRATSMKKATAQFDAAVGLYPGTPVKILGVNVGEITKVKPAGHWVYVTMEYDSKYKLAPDAGAFQVANSLVSDRYIQLSPLYDAKHDHGKWLSNNAKIPFKRTGSPAELDDIYAALDKLSVALGPHGANKDGALAELLKVSAANLKGNGAAIGESITRLSQAAQTLATKRGDLFSTVQHLQRFSHALSDSDGDIRKFNVQLAQVSSDLASERTDLGAALHDLGLALDDVNTFVKNNAGKFHTSLAGLERITKLLVSEKASLNETLAVGPVALANIVHAYQPNLGVIVSRGNLVSLTNLNGKAVCAILEVVIGRAGGVGSGILGVLTKTLNKTCVALLGGGSPGNLQDTISQILKGLGLPPIKLGGLVGQFRDAKHLDSDKIGALLQAQLGGSR